MLCQKEMYFWTPAVQLVFALGSFLLLLLSIERPQRKRRGFVCFYPLRYIYIPKVIFLKSMGLQWKEPKSPCLHPQHFMHRKEERKPSVWQCIPVLSCLQVRNRLYALLVKRQHIAECWDFFFSFPRWESELEFCIQSLLLQAASWWHLSHFRVIQRLVYLLQRTLLSPQWSGITCWMATWVAATLLNIC